MKCESQEPSNVPCEVQKWDKAGDMSGRATNVGFLRFEVVDWDGCGSCVISKNLEVRRVRNLQVTRLERINVTRVSARKMICVIIFNHTMSYFVLYAFLFLS